MRLQRVCSMHFGDMEVRDYSRKRLKLTKGFNSM